MFYYFGKWKREGVFEELADTLWRIIDMLETEDGVSICDFRVDCGSFSEAIIDYVKDHCGHFYVCVGNCWSKRTEFMEHKDWAEVTIGGTECVVASFPLNGFLSDECLRLVVKRTRIGGGDPTAESEGLFGTKYVCRCILTNDCEEGHPRLLQQAWGVRIQLRLPEQRLRMVPPSVLILLGETVSLLVIAMLKNFYRFVL